MCVYLDVTHLPREMLDRKLDGVLEIYQKFQGADPRTTPMKIFPAVHYTMGGLWCDYERSAAGGLAVGSPRNQQTNIPGPVRHRRVRISVSRRQPAGRQFAGGLHLQRLDRRARRDPLRRQPARARRRSSRRRCCDQAAMPPPGPPTRRCSPGRQRPQSLSRPRRVGPADDRGGHGGPPQQGPCRGLRRRSRTSSSRPAAARWPTPATGSTRTWSSPGRWRTCSRWPRRSSGALSRDECRGAHYKPEFAIPDVGGDGTAKTPAAGRSNGSTSSRRIRGNG